MMEWEPIFICAIVFSAVLLLVKMISDNRIRRMLIEKGLVDENVKYLYAGRGEGWAPASLKWGMVLVGIGLALLVGVLVPGLKEATVVACVFLFGGTGLIIYYFYTRQLMKKAK